MTHPVSLPIESCLADIRNALQQHSRLVIQAPPGAGKTTLVPLTLMDELQNRGRIIVIQPRRLAVYGAAWRMADLLEETPGKTIGYTTRFDQKKSAGTRIEVVTEGIFLRMLQTDPELSDISLVIFDEFHERSVINDLALAFALETQQGLREADKPLQLLVMSATLNGGQLSQWLDAPLICSEGRMFPVDTFYRPLAAGQRLEPHLAGLIRESLRQHAGSVLVFLPGMKEINRLYEQLEQGGLPDECRLYRLHSALSQERQQEAIAPPANKQRKIVLTTNVAETSVTIEGIGVVIDCGLARVSRYDERKGMNVLVTEKISAASAEQRRGRAGRVAAGYCYRAWSETEQRQMKAFSDPEMMRTDLLPVALEMAIWGCTDADELQLLTPPDANALERAQTTLLDMNAIHSNGMMTAAGKRMATMGIHPRLAQLIVVSDQPRLQSAAVATAAILSEGDPLRFHQQWPQSDLGLRLSLWQSTRSVGELHRGTWERIKKLSQQLVKRARYQWQPDTIENNDIGISLARAFPEHVARRRKNSHHRYLMANGKGAQLNPEDNLAGQEYLIVLDAGGKEREPYIKLACAMSPAQLETALGEHFQTSQTVQWNSQKESVESMEQVHFHHLVLEQQLCDPDDPDLVGQCLLEGIRALGLQCLPWQDQDRALQQRILWLHRQQPEHWPDWSDTALLTELDHWLLPYLAGIKRRADFHRLNLTQILLAQLAWEQQTRLEQQAPASWTLPTGSLRTIDYDPEKGPILRARMQELYGLTRHPVTGDGQPLLIEILSPANRPIQITRDLVAFWQGSYAEVAKDMRGRYPKHYWPDDPANAQATTKTKRHL